MFGCCETRGREGEALDWDHQLDIFWPGTGILETELGSSHGSLSGMMPARIEYW